MAQFIVTSLIASVILTVALNVLPLLFPNAAAGAMRKLDEHTRRTIDQHEDTNQPRVKVFFPWKAMIIGSIILTVIVNVIAMVSGR